jgi:hypothetical protein
MPATTTLMIFAAAALALVAIPGAGFASALGVEAGTWFTSARAPRR